MPNPIAPRLNGDDYQARHFWHHALDLLDPNSGVESVAYEWKEAKSFDDVAIVYDPPRGQSHKRPLQRHFKQVKWQTTRASRFGYNDLVDPSFINASAISLLERLHQAKRTGGPSTRYSLVTTARIADEDPLSELVSTEDGVLRLDKLRVGKGPTSKMGRVRKVWREALSLSTDDELIAILEDFAVLDGQPDMEAMREVVTTKAKSVGIHLPRPSAAASDFRFDSLAREMIKRDIQIQDRDTLVQFLAEAGISVAPTVWSPAAFRHVAIRSFDRLATDISDFNDEDVLSLLDFFDGRYLRAEQNWQSIDQQVSSFLSRRAKSMQAMRLTLDAHATLAFASGRVLHMKSGIRPELEQNGRKGPEIWHAEDGSNTGSSSFEFRSEKLGQGRDLAVAISIARPTADDVKAYVSFNAPSVGTLLNCMLPAGPNQSGVSGGQHAAALSDQVAARVRELRAKYHIETAHLFVSAPNSFLFYLGQQAQAIGQHQMYEFDFDGLRDGTYIPSVSTLPTVCE